MYNGLYLYISAPLYEARCSNVSVFFAVCLLKTTVYVKIVDNVFFEYIMRDRKEVRYEAEYQD